MTPRIRKPATDIGAALAALPLLWRHDPVRGFATALVPAVVVSALMFRFANLRPTVGGPIGASLRRYRRPRIQAVRLVGGVGVLTGAWIREPLVIAMSVAAIPGAWANGLRVPHPRSER